MCVCEYFKIVLPKDSTHWFNWCGCVTDWWASGKVSVMCLPEQTDDDGAGEQSDEGQAVTQSRQNLYHPVEAQLHTQTHKTHIHIRSIKY